jgi:hypothetical protein
VSAEHLSLTEYMTVARFDKAPPAPESFDATAAVRRVLALAEDMAAAPRGEIMPASGAAILIRRAVEGES